MSDFDSTNTTETGTVKQMFSAEAAKAYVAAVVAGLSAAVGFAEDGFTTKEVLGIVLALVVAFQGTFWVTNKG